MPKISQLPDASGLTGVEPIPIVQDGETRKVPLQDVGDLVQVPASNITFDDTGTWLDADDMQEAMFNLATTGGAGPSASVGTFTSLAVVPPDIGVLTTSVYTSGYSIQGKGAAEYIYDAAVNGAYVTANPRTSFLADDGRGFRLTWFNRHPNPYMFGAMGSPVGETAVDDAVPLQAFFDFVAAHETTADIGGRFQTSVGLELGQDVAPNTKKYVGRFVLTAFAGSSGAVMLTVHDVAGDFESLAIIGIEGAGLYEHRTWEVGIQWDNCGRTKVGYLRGDNFLHCLSDAGPGNNSAIDYGFFKATKCGSGGTTGVYLGVRTDWSNAVDAGTSDSISQTTTVNVDTMPPQFVLDGTYGAIGNFPYLLRVTEPSGFKRLHFIQAINEGAGTLTVHPWIHPDAVEGVADYVFGGGLVVRGNDSNVVHFDVLDAQSCGIGLIAASLYSPTGSNLIAQHCGTGIMWGRQDGGAVLGGGIDGAYFEGNEEDICILSRPSGTVYNRIGNTYGLELDKTYVIPTPRRTDGFIRSQYEGFSRHLLGHEGRIYQYEKGSNNTPYASSSQSIALTRPDMRQTIYRDTATITMVLDRDLHRLMGYDTCHVIIVGTGTNNAPSGTITFAVPAGGYTLNGGAVSVAFSSLTGIAQFVFRFDVVNLAAHVYKTAG